MKFSYKLCSLICFLLVSNLFSQVKVGQWLDHLSYNYSNSVSKVGAKVYFSNGAGLGTYNTGDNSIEKLTKINGLSDIGIKLLRVNDYNNVLLVVYENTNIDIITPNEKIINVSDIKRKIITGKKTINEVFFSGKFAYISCGFGIVVFDTEKLEIKDTYYIGTASANLEVYDVTKNDTAFFAATTDGMFYGRINANLSYFQNWKPLNIGVASGPYNSVVNFNGKIIANYSHKLKTNLDSRDTLYEYTASGWLKYSSNSNCINATNRKLYNYSKYNKLLILDQFGLAEFDVAGTRFNYVSNYGFDGADINDVYFENNNKFWLADERSGLVRSSGGSWDSEKISINGPENNLVNDLDIKDGMLIVAPVNLGDIYSSQYFNYKPNVYQDGEWRSLRSIFADTLKDINAVAIDPNDKTHIAFAGMESGAIEVKSDQIVAAYKYGNSPLVGYGGGSSVWNTGVSFDKNSNLWVSITLGSRCISVKKPNNAWTLLNFEQFVVQPTISKIIFDKYDQAWIILPRNTGLMVYKDVIGLSQPNTSNTKLLSSAEGNGKLPSLDVQAVCEDKDGHIWVGTAKGIAVFYNPENVFTNSNWDSQQILIEQDGNVQILLENDIITSIAVDGVNRKWIGTANSGIYCLSADGQKEIYHFTEENSPLYSNTIIDIVVDEITGDVFFGTVRGIQSYRTSIIKGFEDYTDVHAYPNPIKPGFVGPVYITGLVDESEVKITDVSGNLVWAAKSQGGQLEWNLETFSGIKASTGVYMIYCATANGEKSATAKLLIVN